MAIEVSNAYDTDIKNIKNLLAFLRVLDISLSWGFHADSIGTEKFYFLTLYIPRVDIFEALLVLLKNMPFEFITGYHYNHNIHISIGHDVYANFANDDIDDNANLLEGSLDWLDNVDMDLVP